jgi:hypothetical protein
MDTRPFPYKFNFPNGSLMELPVTILPTRFPFNRINTMAKHYFRQVDNYIMLRILRRLLYQNQPLWLRPYSWTTMDHFEEMIIAARAIRLPYMVMIFHSSELMPGSSIYRADNKAIEKLYELLENFFRMVVKEKIASVTLTEAAIKFNQSIGVVENAGDTPVLS